MAAAAGMTATLGTGVADAAGTFNYGDTIRSFVTYSGSDCLGWTEWQDDGSRYDGYTCDGWIEIQQSADPGRWVGIEPKPTAETSVTCHMTNLANAQTLLYETTYWDSPGTGSLRSLGSLGPPAPMCMIQLP
ncbi:hypothetical protein [Rhodococcus marinonascens]|uniref:hypothetical protein n=1 Tax=Rhodococcus marinonascens TaxID=38311 RepID=UPI001475D09E|nr:hypothetical protein [Rhodococcus marinonascens]